MDILYPRNEWLIQHLKDDPAVHLFRDVFGPQVPREQWNDRGTRTKQGVYAMLPDGTYLGALFVGTRTGQVREMMGRALESWREALAESGREACPVPQIDGIREWAAAESGADGAMIEIHVRDLPRPDGAATDGSGRPVGGSWNRNWLALDGNAVALLAPPDAGDDSWQPVSADLAQRIAREVLKDTVYGQSPRWREEAVLKADLRVRRSAADGEGIGAEYQGEFHLRDDTREIRASLFGAGVWRAGPGGEDASRPRLQSLEWAASGIRSGGTTYNFRNDDPGPAPLGWSFLFERATAD